MKLFNAEMHNFFNMLWRENCGERSDNKEPLYTYDEYVQANTDYLIQRYAELPEQWTELPIQSLS